MRRKLADHLENGCVNNVTVCQQCQCSLPSSEYQVRTFLSQIKALFWWFQQSGMPFFHPDFVALGEYLISLSWIIFPHKCWREKWMWWPAGDVTEHPWALLGSPGFSSWLKICPCVRWEKTRKTQTVERKGTWKWLKFIQTKTTHKHVGQDSVRYYFY